MSSRFLVALVFVSCSSPSKPASNSLNTLRAASCVGPTHAQSFAVYLHGVDTSPISDQELKNRISLQQVAEALSISIALPRAATICPHQSDSLCWGWEFNDSEIDTAVDKVKQAANECFGDRPFGLIGFSNGGYLLSKILRTCSLAAKLPKVDWLIAIGSGMIKGVIEPEPTSLAGCGRMVFLEGVGDTYNHDPSKHLLMLLKAKGADVEAVTFDGGHTVPSLPLKAVIEDLLH